jgi:hypothetical protein
LEKGVVEIAELEVMNISGEDLNALKRAVQTLEYPSFATRLTNLVGKPIEMITNMLPVSASQAISKATAKALEVALKIALRTMQSERQTESPRLHKVLVTASGAAGGAFGLISLPVELPASTVIMLRAIADIARSEGENLSDPEAALSCVQVFALGGRAGSNDASESGYFAVRALLAKSVTEAASFIAERGLVGEGAPLLVRFLAQVASRFGVVVSQKVAVQALPIVGALGGAAVNYAFLEHFRQTARGHFTVRRLERRYGKNLVQKEYERLAKKDPGPQKS